MIGVMLLLAVACLFADSAEQWLPGNRRFVMAGVLVVYTGIRWYRLQAFKKRLHNEQNDAI
jgi:predicted acyltransferase